MMDLSEEEIKDAFESYKNGDIGLDEAVGIILLFQSENRVKPKQKMKNNHTEERRAIYCSCNVTILCARPLKLENEN